MESRSLREILRGLMSEKNVEIVKEFSQRFAEGGHVTRRYFDPEIVWDTSASGMPGAGIYNGLGGVRRFWGDWLEPWEDYEIEYSEFADVGDSVMCVFRQAATGKGSGIRSKRDFFALWDLKDSKVVRFRLFESREQALEAAGLSE
jgi:ketosteroid isomerase-like protein